MPDCIDKIRLLNDPLFITLKVEQFMFYVSGQKLFILQICTCAIYKNQTQNSNEQKKKKKPTTQIKNKWEEGKKKAAKIISFSEVGLKKLCLIEFKKSLKLHFKQ